MRSVSPTNWRKAYHSVSICIMTYFVTSYWWNNYIISVLLSYDLLDLLTFVHFRQMPYTKAFKINFQCKSCSYNMLMKFTLDLFFLFWSVVSSWERERRTRDSDGKEASGLFVVLRCYTFFFFEDCFNNKKTCAEHHISNEFVFLSLSLPNFIFSFYGQFWKTNCIILMIF